MAHLSLVSTDLGTATRACVDLSNQLDQLNQQENPKVSHSAHQLALQVIETGCIVRLLQLAQLPQRDLTFAPSSNTPQDILQAADAALILLSQLCACSVAFLQSHGWEVAEDDDGRCLYQNASQNVVQRHAPELSVMTPDDANWSERLLCELPFLIAPYSDGTSLVWPVKVISLVDNVAVLDVREEDGVSRQMIIGHWKGLAGFRETEVDMELPFGHHLENWYTCTLAGLGLYHTKDHERPKVLVVGLGGGSLQTFLQAHSPRMELYAVEKLPHVATAAKKHFGLDERIHVIVDDMVHFVESTSLRFECVILDVFTDGDFPEAINNRDFYRSVKRVSQCLIVNAGSPEVSSSIRDLLADEFGQVTTCHDFNNADEENIVLTTGEPITQDGWNKTLNKLDVDDTAVGMPFTLEKLENLKELPRQDHARIAWGFYDRTRKKPTEVKKLDSNHSAWSVFD